MSANLLEHPRPVKLRTLVRELRVTEETIEGKRSIVCEYEDGEKLHGKSHPANHQGITLSVKTQNEIIWYGNVSFRVAFGLVKKPGNAGPPHPFYRSDFDAVVDATGKIFTVASGPLHRYTVVKQIEYKFSIYRLLPNGTDDPDCEPLDPHIVVEP